MRGMVRSASADLAHRFLLALATLLAISVAPAAAGSVRLVWDANAESDLAGYVVVYGTTSRVYTRSAQVGAQSTTYDVTGLNAGRTYYFAVRAFNVGGLESALSNEVAVTLPGQGISAPTIAGVSPSTGPAAGGTTVSITGTNFASGASVRFGASVGQILQLTTTSLSVRTPAGAGGPVSVSVTNPDGGTATRTSAFTYQLSTDAPVITTVEPARGAPEGGNAVTVNGGPFGIGTSVAFDGQTATVLSAASDRVTVRVPAHAPGSVSVLVRNAAGQSVSKAGGYTYDANAPVVTGLSPAAGPMTGETTVTITGVRFTPDATVRFDGVLGDIISVSPTTIIALTPAHNAGVTDVTVSSGALSAVLAGGFTFEDSESATEFVRYFAEGASGEFFRTRFALANPHAQPVDVTATFTDTRGVATTMTLTVPATGRATIDESNRPALASDAFATRFKTDREIGIDRTMLWAGGGEAYGAHSETGIAAPRTSWLVAEGATIGGLNLFYLLQNPTDQTAEVQVQYLLSTGTVIEKTHTVAPMARTNIWVNKDDPALASAEMSATFTSLNDVPIVVERSMYRNTGGELFTAGHNSAAVAEPALRWFLAEGATGGTFDMFVLIANPNPAAAELQVSYLRAGSAPIVKTYQAAPLSRMTLWVDQEDPALASAEVSVVVESVNATPVVVERAMWWRGSSGSEWTEAHNSAGVTATASRWVVADGEAGGSTNATTFVLVANTGPEPAGVRFTLLGEDGTTHTIDDVVSGNGRYSLDVAAAFAEARNQRFSVLVESLSGSAPLVVERATYWDAGGITWAAGTNSLGMPLRTVVSDEWRLSP